MRRGRELLGLPVISLAQAAKVGEVKDLVIDPSRRALGALLLAEGGRRQASRQVGFEAVRRIGPDAIMIDDEASVVAIPEEPRRLTFSGGRWRLLGVRVLTEGGHTVGSVSDMVVDERSGRIDSYQLSGGAVRDVFSGRIQIPATLPRAIGTDYMVVRESAVLSRQAQLEEGPPLVVEAPAEEPAGLPLSEIERVAADVVSRQEDLVIGMRANKTVDNEDAGGVICVEGEPITEETVDRAKAAGKLNQLIQTAGAAAAAALSSGLAEQYARVAVGRMAGGTVRSPEGQVVVSQGDVVTQEVVDRAREAGVLDQLMEAVHLTPEETSPRWSAGREAARTLWSQVGGGFGRFTRRRERL